MFDLRYLRYWHTRYNKLVFAGKLSKPAFIIKPLGDEAAGYCEATSPPTLYIDAGLSKREARQILLHEMIHQWQYDVLKRRPNHGQDFRRMMARMNQDGLGITVYHSLGKEVMALAKYAWRCQQCGSIYRRQRRTIQPRRHLCGACRGPLREFAVVPDTPLAEPVPVGPIGRQFSLPFQPS